MKNVFISFSSKQTDEAMEMCRFVESHGYECFIATRDLIPGEEYAAQLLANIDESNVLVLLLSQDSNTSVQCLREIEYAVRSKTPIIVYPLEQVVLARSMEYFLMTHQWITDYGDKKENLISSIERIVSRVQKNTSTHCNSSEYSNDNGLSNGNDELKEPKTPPVILPARGRGKYIKKSTKIMVATIILFSLIIIALLAVLFYTRSNTALHDTNDTSSSVGSSIDTSTNNSPSNKSQPVYNVGDTVTLGSYYNAPIEWRVIKVNDDGTMYLISRYILTIKAFDSAEGGEYNNYDGVDYWSYDNHIIDDPNICIMARGSNVWSDSNIRTWLNSSDEVVDYEDQAPTKKAVGDNFYSSEAGFLYNFNKDEQDALVGVTHDSKIDKVFLLSSAELKWLTDAGISLYTEPTEECTQHNDDKAYYEDFVATYSTKNYYWWLRDSYPDKANEAYLCYPDIEEDITYKPASVGISTYGIRPVICVDMSSSAINLN